MLKTWRDHVHRDGRPHYLGEVRERTETLARCAALHRYGVGDAAADAGEARFDDEAIRPDDEFDVSPRS